MSITSAARIAEAAKYGVQDYPGGYAGRGIVICAGGETYFPCAWVCIRMLRKWGCTLPIQVWHLGTVEMDEEMKRLLLPFNVDFVDAERLRKTFPMRILGGWEMKPYSLLHTRFREVLLLDADNVPVRNPEYLFDASQFLRAGAVFWPDFGEIRRSSPVWQIFGVPFSPEPEFETGQILVDKSRCWRALCLAKWYNSHSDFYYRYIEGDKETFHMAFKKLGQPFAMPNTPVRALPGAMLQHDFDGQLVFQHRNSEKWRLNANKSIPGFRWEAECIEWLADLRRKWKRASRTPNLKAHTLSGDAAHVGDELTSNVFEYKRIGFDQRNIEFLRDGSIGKGAAGCEMFWDLSEENGDLILSIYSNSNLTCRLKPNGKGSWTGRWEHHEQMPVELTPVGFQTEPVLSGEKKAENRDKREKNLFFRCALNAFTGYGLHACQIASDFERMQYDVFIRALALDERFAPIPHMIRRNIICKEPENEWELLLNPPDFSPLPNKRTVWFTMWESTRLRVNQVNNLNAADHIIVPSQWNASCFNACGVKRPIWIVPLGIDSELFKPFPMDLNGPCVFGAAARLAGGGGARKNLDEVIRLFVTAFPKEKDVRLRIKAFPDCKVPHISDQRVEVVQQYFSPRELAAWFAGLTCFVSAARGEGWGLMQHQAMATGRPIISPRFGGLTEFFSRENGYPVDFRLVPAEGRYLGSGLWAEPDQQHLIELMRRVYRDRLETQALGAKASASVAGLTWSNSNLKLMKVLQSIGAIA